MKRCQEGWINSSLDAFDPYASRSVVPMHLRSLRSLFSFRSMHVQPKQIADATHSKWIVDDACLARSILPSFLKFTQTVKFNASAITFF